MSRTAIAITPLGTLWFYVALAGFPVGLYLRSGPLLLLAVLGMGALWVARCLARRQLRKIEGRRALPKRLFLGEAFAIGVEASHGRRGGVARDMRLRDHLAGSGGSEVFIDEIGAGSASTLEYQGRLFQRGRVAVPGFTLTSRWPFGWFECRLESEFIALRPGDESILVAPKPLIPRHIDRVLHQIEQQAAMHSAQLADELAEFRAIRPMRPGDAVRDIHWPTSSRSDQLMVRETDPPQPRPRSMGIYLFHHTPSGEMVQPDRFEHLLRIACGLVVRFWQAGYPLVARIELAEAATYQAPAQDSYHSILDALATASYPVGGDLDGLADGWDIYDECDQVFVLCDSDHRQWRGHVESLHPSIICIDTETISRGRPGRKAKVAKRRRLA